MKKGTNIKRREPKRQPAKRWWLEENRHEIHESIGATTGILTDEDAVRRARFLRLASRYANRPIQGLGFDAFDQTDVRADEGGMRMNVTRGMVDSVQAKIAKNKPKPTVLTDGGDFELRQKAKRLDTYLWGQFHRTKAHQKGSQIFRDAECFGTGVLKVLDEDVDDKMGSISVDRVLPWELLVDPLEGVHGEPRSLFHQKLIDRDVLLRMFADAGADGEDQQRIDEAIKDCPAAPTHRGRAGYADQVLVTEAWHLPSGKDAGDGLRAVVIETGALQTREWTDPSFPFVFFHWTRPIVGMWGDSLIEEVEDLQDEIDELVTKIQQAFWHHATPKWLLPTGGKINKAEINNDIRGCEIHYSGGEPPVLQVFSTVAPEMFSHLDWLFERTYNVAGVSQLSAASEKPAGLDSAPAQREYEDISSERFVIRGQDYEQLFVDLADQIVLASRRLHERGLDVEIRAENRKRRKSFLEKIRWSEVDLDAESFALKIFPSSSLPQSPAGRMAAVEGLAKAGLIQPQDAMSLLDFPDVESVVSRELAPYDLVLDQVERMLDEGKPVMPNPYQDVKLAHRIGQLTICQAEMDEVPEERLDLLREYVLACEDLDPAPPATTNPAAAPPGAEPLMPGPAMPGVPVPPGPALPPTPIPEAA